MALRQEHKLKQAQKLSPLQMQVVRLMELNSLELEERVKQELEDNPALDEGSESDFSDSDDMGFDEDYTPEKQEDMILADYKNEEETPDYRLNISQSKYDESNNSEYPLSGDISLQEHLIQQLSLRLEGERDKILAEYIVGSLDENGYLQRQISAIADDLLFQQFVDVTEEELLSVLREIQNCDPAGVGARNLQECLLLQLYAERQTPIVVNATKILKDLFIDFSNKHYDKIIKRLNISEDDLRDAIELVLTLNPKPGASWSDSFETAMSVVTPDFIVEVDGEEVSLSLNSRNVPELRVNRDYSEMMKGYAENKQSMSSDAKQVLVFMKQKVDSARWFIDAVNQRQQTLRRTMETIVSMQYDFFLTGDESALKPMILKDVAEKTGYDISTISRVSTSKYVQTDRGIYPLKFFFSEAMHTDQGEDVSSREIKSILKETIAAEDPKKPFTDEHLTSLLNEKGYLIARRTVAKYREQLNIRVARLRKEL